ncbi:uncharacterized protein LOC123557874 isoform X2 [Mercenaria mercenaria]|uniref:uncharacterized protein LOC123557874 isoform X2 n=1 Tax=Mercenaria mercenaria TaxID=6596 RepID=UPI00234F54A7|nr:uncharacterized protein LOC123557874 isoform X2 [Mercenaria mercenaria]
MGGTQSFEPEDYPKGNAKGRQHGYPVKHYTPRQPYNERQYHTSHSHNQRSQQQSQQHYPQRQERQQQQQQQQQRRHVSALSTPELLEYLDSEFMSTVDIIRNMKNEKHFDDGGRRYICDIMIEKKILLRKFNISMEPSRRPAVDEELQRLRGKIKDLQEENSRLDAERILFDGLLTSSMRQPSTKPSSHDRPISSGYNETITRDKENKGSTDKIKELQQKLSVYARDLEDERAARVKATSYIDHLKQQLEEVKTEKNALQMRLSKMAGDRLVRNNPAIADLSDPNRPTKIGEMYSEMYDNEWTDAFEALSNAGYSDQDAIETLRLTLLNVFQFCSRKAESLLKKTEEAVNILFEEYKATEQKSEQWGKLVRRSSFTDDLETIALQDKWKPNSKGYQGLKRDQTILKTDKSEVAVVDQLKKFRKEVAESMVPIVEKAYMSASWNDKCVYALKPFIKKCIFLGWMMVVQSPPMTLAECKPGENLEKEAYKEYTQRGSIIDFVVWPALLLNQGGPVVGKGVAQAKKLN